MSLDENDRYCLDGKRLIVVAGIHGASGTYRTELDTFSRVTSIGSDPSKGPDSWVVETKDGRILRFGETADSYVEAVGTVKPRLWAVNRVEDRRGNYMTFHYAEDGQTGEHLPLQVRYTGHGTTLAPDLALRFEYEATGRPDPFTRYLAGTPIRASRRLAKISTWLATASDGSGGQKGTETVIRYVTSTSTGRSLVDRIELCAADGTCLPATHFTWTTRPSSDNNFAASGSGGWGGPAARFTTARTFSAVLSSVKVGDVNGDGKTDLFKSNENGTWQVCLSTGAGFSCTNWSAPAPATDTTMTGDFNGDGKTDLMLTDPSNTICLSTGSSFSCQVWPGFYVGEKHVTVSKLPPSFDYVILDINGDGRDDVMRRRGYLGHARACFSQSTGFSCDDVTDYRGFFDPNLIDYMEPENRCSINTTRWSPALGDFNGDRRTDVLPITYLDPNCLVVAGTAPDNKYSMCRISDTGTVCSSAITGLGKSTGFTPQPGNRVADLNGDGYADIVLPNLGASAEIIKVCLSNGASGMTCRDQIFAGGAVARHVADFDGDGRPDVLQAKQLCQVADSQLVCAPAVVPTANSSAGEVGPVYADFDGNGQTDLAFYNMSTSQWRIALAGGTVPDLLATVTNGVGQAVEFSYSAMNNPEVHIPGVDVMYPQRNVRNGGPLVARMRTSNGQGGWMSMGYTYEARRTDLLGRGDLGFAAVARTDAVSRVQSRVTAKQDFPFIGMATEERRVHVPSNVLLEHVSVTLQRLSTEGSAVHPYEAERVVLRKDLDGSPLPTSRVAVGPADIDAYGNILKKTEVLEAAGETFTTVTQTSFENRVSSWLIGLPTRTSVTRNSQLPSVPLPPPALRLSSCSAVSSPTVSPVRAVATCVLANTGTGAASGITYSGVAGGLISGPSSCAASTENCGNVTISSGTAAGTYAGTATATPTPVGRAGAAVVPTLVVTAATPTLSLTGCTSTSPTVSPSSATQRCTLGNTGTAAATSISYATAPGTSIAGPTSCAASTLNCGTVTVTSGTAPGTYSGTVSAVPTPTGTSATSSISLVVQPSSPSLTLGNCSSTNPTTTPTAASMSCTLGNTGQTSASAIAYSTPAGTSATGPGTCAAQTASCGTVTVTTSTAPGTYAGTLTATPNAGSSASAGVNLIVNSGPASLTLTACATTTPTVSPTPAQMTCTVGNTSQAAANGITYTTASGTNAAGPGTCAAQTASCGTVTVTTSASPGTYTGTLTAMPSSGSSATASVSLVVNPSPASLTLSGCSSTTPTTSPTAAQTTCSLGNSGQTAASAIAYTGPSGTSASGPSTCAAQTSNCGVVILATGTSPGTYAGTLTATPGSGVSASTSVNLVVNATLPILTLSGCSAASPTMSPTPATMTCSLGNSGQTAASDVAYSAPAGTTVAGPAACSAGTANCGTVTVTTGSAPGAYSGSLGATPNAGTGATVAVSLTVNATLPALTLGSCTSTSPTTSPTAATMQCVLSNSGQTAAGSVIYASGTGTSANGPANCAGSTSNCGTVTVVTGSSAGTYSGTVTATPSSGTSSSAEYSLVVSPPPSTQLSASSTTMAFGTVPKDGTTSTKTVTVTNIGNASAVLSRSFAYTAGTADMGIYSLGGTCTTGATLLPGGSCTVTARFWPGCVAGPRNGTLTVSGSNFPTLAISVTAATGSTGICQ